MNGADAIDLLTELLGRRGRVVLAFMMLAGLFVLREPTIHFISWFAAERAHELTQHISTVLTTHPTMVPVSSPAQ